MKTKTFLITVITLLLLTGLTGCDNSNNDDICTFNVDDPINDLDWLKNEITKMTSPNYSVHFYLYQNKKNSQKYFFNEDVQLVGGQQYLQSVEGYSYTIIYNYKGDTLLSKGIGSPSTKAWDDFFEENILIKQIWPNE